MRLENSWKNVCPERSKGVDIWSIVWYNGFIKHGKAPLCIVLRGSSPEGLPIFFTMCVERHLLKCKLHKSTRGTDHANLT